ncbi:hypothetical protein [Tropicimonas sediminicola]|uniref:Uncharacterized protein n=1 Tax=Tropicimonas sediminicola TaxID=1031541 RepID=A0A239J8Q2_9RHOB|nr:hypothetical protein [Tropicimonas sediminicola]SNT02159.1 hypothetical protein SAMN05421757_105156 [Tropicimonas sediminicola]
MLSQNTSLSRISMRRALRWVLIAQGFLAVFLVLSDFQPEWLLRPGSSTDLPAGPVSPGDQVRRYEPSRTQPDFTNPGALPQIEFPDDVPERLEFTLETLEGVGDFVLVNGAIAPGDAQRLEAFLAGLETPPESFALNSTGGAVEESLKIGRSLRAREANTIMLPGNFCLSACPYMLAAGTERSVSLRSAVGLHQHYYDAPGYMPVFLAVEGIQAGQGRTMEYLIEMGVDPGVMVHSLATPPDQIYVLVEEELVESRMATAITE